MPSNIKSIWGSNDDVNWTKITTGNETFRGDDRLEFKNLDNPNYYKYHAIIADAFTQLKDVKLFGVRKQGSSTLHDGTLTLTKNLDVPRIGPPLDADDTPRRDRLVVEYNTHKNPLEDGVVRDTSGRGNDGVLAGTATYDATMKALEFTGDDSGYIEGRASGAKGEWLHSSSLWFKFDVIEQRYLYLVGNQTTTGPGRGVIGCLLLSSTISFTLFGKEVNSTTKIKPGNWYHLASVYRGGIFNETNFEIYLNGVRESIASVNNPGNESISLTSEQLFIGNIGGSNELNGLISNFKLYDTTLTAEEVKTLYDMGRCSSAIPKTLHIMGGMMRYNNDINKLQIHNGERWSTIGGTSAIGGTVTSVDGYTIHTFTSSATFTVISGGEVEYLVVAGGGGGSNNLYSGGGGAGGMLTGSIPNVTPGDYTVTIGAGGTTGTNGTNGSNSLFGTVIATGGGGGASYNTNGFNGGSGGGGGYDSTNNGEGLGSVGGTASPSGQGNNGGRGNGVGGYGWGGGGGGAGGAGVAAKAPITNQPGHGGVGAQSSITGTATYYAGGAGGRIDSVGYYANGGTGGGGNGTQGTGNGDGTAGGANTGGGGGPSKSGGSGIVIIRYLA